MHEAGLTLKAGLRHRLRVLHPAAKGRVRIGRGRYTSGPLSFMDIYDKMCFTVSSAGGRRGAQMATFDVGHPDALEFIRAKREDGRLRQFNLSLLITKEFMEAVKRDAQWQLAFPVTAKEIESDGIDLSNPSEVVWRQWPVEGTYVRNDAGLVACKVYKSLPARRVWDLIMSSTYDLAEPGFILIDEVNEMNNNWFCENIRATNPCGEQPLPPYGSCLLGSVNLTKFVVKPFTAEARFDWDTFRETVAVFTRMLDNVVEVNGLPLDEQRREILDKATSRHGVLGAWLHHGHAAQSLWKRGFGSVYRRGRPRAGVGGLENRARLGAGERARPDHGKGLRGHQRHVAPPSGDGGRWLQTG